MRSNRRTRKCSSEPVGFRRGRLCCHLNFTANPRLDDTAAVSFPRGERDSFPSKKLVTLCFPLIACVHVDSITLCTNFPQGLLHKSRWWFQRKSSIKPEWIYGVFLTPALSPPPPQLTCSYSAGIHRNQTHPCEWHSSKPLDLQQGHFTCLGMSSGYFLYGG